MVVFPFVKSLRSLSSRKTRTVSSIFIAHDSNHTVNWKFEGDRISWWFIVFTCFGYALHLLSAINQSFIRKLTARARYFILASATDLTGWADHFILLALLLKVDRSHVQHHTFSLSSWFYISLVFDTARSDDCPIIAAYRENSPSSESFCLRNAYSFQVPIVWA